jgi:hypothetical protein
MSEGVLVPQLTTTPSVDCEAFKRLQIQTNPLGGNVITWQLETAFTQAHDEPYHFYVDYGKAGTDEWEVINTVPVVDHCLFIDPCQRHFSDLVDYFYRVRLVLPGEADGEGLCPYYISRPHQANGVWSHGDWLMAREIVRKEMLMTDKRTNKTNRGYLLKQKKYGTKFYPSREWDTRDIQHTDSTEDFGTGFPGGYFPAIDYTVTMDTPWSRSFKRHPQLGTVQSERKAVVKSARALAYPYPESYDVYVRRDNGERYIIHNIDTLVELGGIPLVLSLELRLAPTTEIIHQVPTERDESSSSPSSDSSPSTTQAEACGPRRGLSQDGTW